MADQNSDDDVIDDNKELYNKLNNFFPTDKSIDEAKQYLRDGSLPEYVNTNKKARRYKNKLQDFEIQDSYLVFVPLDLAVIPKSETTKVLENLYMENDQGLGKAILSLYKFVRQNYLNITRKEVRAFILGEPDYQLVKDFKHRINKPIVAHYPNQIWCVDLIDMSLYQNIRGNRNYRYILTIVDVFSRKVWVEKTKDKEASTIASAFNRAINRAGISPKYLISDRGTEFQGDFSAYCKENEIAQRFNRAYSPEANGIVERANREVRKLLRAFMAKNNKLVWIDLLSKVESNKNNTYHGLIKTNSNAVWTPDKRQIRILNVNDELDDENVNENLEKQKLKARNNVLKKVKTDIKRFKDTELEVGDLVRVKMTTISNNLRRLEKEGQSKQMVIRYTPLIFEITKKIIPKKGFLERERYYIRDIENGRPLYVKSATGLLHLKQFYASDLLKVPTDKNETGLTLLDAFKLNKVEPNRNDLYFLQGDEAVPYLEEPRPTRARQRADLVIQEPRRRPRRPQEAQPEYEVSHIETHTGQPRRGRKEHMRFLTHWVGYDEPTWQKFDDIKNTIAFRDYARENGLEAIVPPSLR